MFTKKHKMYTEARYLGNRIALGYLHNKLYNVVVWIQDGYIFVQAPTKSPFGYSNIVNMLKDWDFNVGVK